MGVKIDPVPEGLDGGNENIETAGNYRAFRGNIFIAAYACIEDGEVEFFTPKIVLMEEGNRIGEIK